MASLMSLPPRQRLLDCLIMNPTSTCAVRIRGSGLGAQIRHTYIIHSTKSTSKSRNFGTRVFFKNNSWDVPATESIDDETAKLLDKYAATFHEADINKDGLLHRAELRALLERVGGGQEHTPLHWLNDDDLDAIFNQYDEDGDNAINLREFMNLAHDNVFLTKELAEYQACFRAVDQNQDGFLSPTELLSVLSKVGSPLKSYENIVRLMNKYDTDKNGRMDFGEFLRLCRYEKALPIDAILKYAAARAASKKDEKERNNTLEAHNSSSLNNSTTSATTASTTNATTATSLGATATAAAAPTSTAPPSSPSPAATPTDGSSSHNEQLVVAISNEEYFNGIFECNQNKLVVVMGSLTWCRPCKRFNPVYQRMAAAYPQVVFLHLNGNDSEETKQLFKHKLKIRATPAFLFFRNGVLVDNCSGANASRFESHLRALLNKDEMPAKSLYELIDLEEDAAKAKAEANAASK